MCCFAVCAACVISGSSAAWLARLPWEQEVAGSNPAFPMFIFEKNYRALKSEIRYNTASSI